MKCGLDTNVLVYAHIAAFKEHQSVRRFLVRQVADESVTLILAPIILHEFIHIVTDPRRFEAPLTMDDAVSVARLLLQLDGVECASIDEAALVAAFDLLERHQLGRRRIADTLFASTLLQNGVREIITCNPRDYQIFEDLRVIDPREA